MNEHSFIFANTMRTRDDNKIQAIRTEALKMLAKEGFDGFSIQKLAKAANVSPGTIYIYFKDKEDLILNVFASAADEMSEATLKGYHTAMSFAEGLRLQWTNRLKHCLKNPYQMKLWEQVRNSPLDEKAQAMMSPVLRETLKAFVENAIKRKELIQLPLEVYWSIAFAPLYTLANFHIAGTSVGGRKFALTNKTIDATFELVLKALTP